MLNGCNVCNKATKQQCSSCKLVSYCSRECQKKDWKQHKSNCRPYAVQEHEIYGRYLVTTRDIAAGEIFLKESPLVIGPKQCSLPICLGCHQKMLNGSRLCSTCRFPVCSQSCQTSVYHKKECEILSKAKARLQFSNQLSPHPAYECIMPLRCLLLHDDDTQKFDQIMNLQSHLSDLKDTQLYVVNQRNIVEFIRVFFGYDDVKEELIHKICGILLTNSFEITFKKEKIRGLYAMASMLAHSCAPNAKHDIDENCNIIFRTTQNIKKGNPIFITYSNRFWDTFSRRNALKITKFFMCGCSRCTSPTELDSHVSTLICSGCSKHMLSSNTEDTNAPWVCGGCGREIPSKQIEWGHKVMSDELKRMGKIGPSALESFRERYRNILHRNHRFMIEAEYALVKLYGNSPSFYYKDLTLGQIQNKIAYAKHLLEVSEKIDPGKSLLRGTLLFELQAAVVAEVQVQFSNDEIDEPQSKETMRKAAVLLQEASEILRHESEMANGGMEEKLKWLGCQLDM